VTPHFDPTLMEAARAAGLATTPGVATPSEAFAAIRAGADALKLFPAEAMPPAVVKALRSVMPASVRLLPVGGITSSNMASYVAAGASGFGIGSALYKPGVDAKTISENAREFVAAWREIRR
jgi:2-dehydro-3-deoxyphosphogalactonate aldolase